MSLTRDLRWLRSIITRLRPADATLAIDLLARMAEFRTDEFAPARGRLPKLREPTPDHLSEWGRQALFEKLRDDWRTIRDLAPCTRQCQVLSETSVAGVFGQLSTDPISEGDEELTHERIRAHAERALSIARLLPDRVEEGRALYPLGCLLYKALNDQQQARQVIQDMRRLAEEVGSVDLAERAAGLYEELLSLGEVEGDRLVAQEDVANLAMRSGNPLREFSVRCHLAIQRLALGEHESAGEQRQRIEVLRLALGETDHVERHYWSVRSRFASAAGDITTAISSEKSAIEANVASDRPDEPFLWYDLARLERLYLDRGDHESFVRYCDSLRLGLSTNLQQPYLTPCPPPPPVGAPALGGDWQVVNGDQGHVQADTGSIHEVAPIPGTGFAAAVNVRRLARQISGDFTIQVSLEGDAHRWAGGILVRESDDRLVRYGAGTQAYGEISFSIKKKGIGITTPARGLVTDQHVTMRLFRRAETIKVNVLADGHWWAFEPLAFPMTDPLEIGLYAESAYEAYALERCQNSPVRFKNLVLQIHR